MKKVTHYKTFDQDRWRAVPVPHLVNLNRFRISEITGKKYVFIAGVSARCLRFSDGSEYHADGFWS